jgi:hypothetical protein
MVRLSLVLNRQRCLRAVARVVRIAVLFLCLALAANAGSEDVKDYFKITVVDAETRRGVPLVELRTTNEIRYVTDSNGIVAFYEPGLMDQTVFFSLISHGYAFPKDGFGYPGVALKTTRGGSAVVKIPRVNIAERLYRITGEGIYRDSLLVGMPAPLRQPLLNGQVMGQDTVEVVPYRGRLYWFWGDTSRPSYPLGNFHTSGATSLLPGKGGLDPDLGIDLTYFVDANGFSRGMLPRSEPGPVWIGGLITVQDENGRERLITNYARIKSLGEVLERGLAVFNDTKEIFEPVLSLDRDSPQCPLGHPFHALLQGKDYIYSSLTASEPYPCVRVPADLKHLRDPHAYETFTCLTAGCRYEKAESQLDRSPEGKLRYGWKAATAPIGGKEQQELIKAGKLKPEEALLQLRDVETGKPLQPHGGSVYWNAYRRKWVMICEQFGGTSLLGEIWFAEADTPVGPWVYAKKVVTHHNMSFYNPTQHPFFDQEGGRRLYFEGTYTVSFTNNPDPTPRYEYNQILYRLSLDDPRLALPAPVYRVTAAPGVRRYQMKQGVEETNAWERIEEIPFFAVPGSERQTGLIPIYGKAEASGTALQREPPERISREAAPLFYALPAESSGKRQPSPETALLYGYRDSRTGARLYTIDPNRSEANLTRSAQPLCRVWRNPMASVILDYRTRPLPTEH